VLSGCGDKLGQRYDGPEERELLTVAGIEMELIWEPDTPLDAVPVVSLQGAWEADQVPTLEDRTDLLRGYGLLQVHLDLPGAPRSGTELDRLGAESRAAGATALRFAVGDEVDSTGGTVLDRRPELRTGALILVGSSNGGNLAVATLADPDLDLPTVAGFAAWETPCAAQFVLREVTLESFESCSLGEAVVCEVDLSALIEGDPPWLDLDGDGTLSETEPRFAGLDLGEHVVHSPVLTAVLPEREDRATVAESESFFAWREASRLADEAVERFPDLAVIVTGNAKDHGDTLPGHPQVIGLGAAFEQAGAWVRLLGDKSYTGLVPEVPAGEGLDLVLWGPLYPGDPHRPSYLLSHAVRELADRTLTDTWDPDLETALR